VENGGGGRDGGLGDLDGPIHRATAGGAGGAGAVRPARGEPSHHHHHRRHHTPGIDARQRHGVEDDACAAGGSRLAGATRGRPLRGRRRGMRATPPAAARAASCPLRVQCSQLAGRGQLQLAPAADKASGAPPPATTGARHDGPPPAVWYPRRRFGAPCVCRASRPLAAGGRGRRRRARWRRPLAAWRQGFWPPRANGRPAAGGGGAAPPAAQRAHVRLSPARPLGENLGDA